jgi:atypical dual specificity phosphatase
LRRVVSAYYGPTGFCWLTPGLLGGCPAPGITGRLEADLEALQRVGTRWLITLTEKPLACADLLQRHEIGNLHLAIPDREAPTIAQAAEMTDLVATFMARDEPVVYHCLAGKGRTGTLLACQLLRSGLTFSDAITTIRQANRHWIETDVQMEFLSHFADHCRARTESGEDNDMERLYESAEQPG